MMKTTIDGENNDDNNATKSTKMKMTPKKMDTEKDGYDDHQKNYEVQFGLSTKETSICWHSSLLTIITLCMRVGAALDTQHLTLVKTLHSMALNTRQSTLGT